MDKVQAHKLLRNLAVHRMDFSVSESRLNFFARGVGRAIEKKACSVSCCGMENRGIITKSRLSASDFLFSIKYRHSVVAWVTVTSNPEKAGWRYFVGDAMTASYRIPMSEKLRQEILERDAFMCAYCDEWADSVDHIIPYSYCQNNDKDNLVACCLDCNLIASDKIFESLSDKRAYIRNKRGLHKWRMKFLNRYSLCIVCKERYLEGHKNATHFICPRCRMRGLEWAKEIKKK